MATIPQLDDLKDHLQALNIQKANFGISTPPYISNEISKLEVVVQQMDLIEIQRRNLDHLIRQRDTYAGQPPIHVLNQIADARAQIARLRQVCADRGYSVAKHELDDDTPAPLPPIAPRPVLSAIDREDIESKLDRIARLVAEIRAML